MHFKLLFLVVLIAFLQGCGGGAQSGESSQDALLDENKKPLAFDQHIVLDKNETKLFSSDGGIPIVLEAKDEDGDLLHYEVVSKPDHGYLKGKAPYFTLVPPKDYVGAITFTFLVSDGKDRSRIATVVVEIKSAQKAPSKTPSTPPKSTPTPPSKSPSPHSKKEPPVAVDDSATVQEGDRVQVDVLANDYDKDGVVDSSSLEIIKASSYGEVKVENGKIIYTPKKNYTEEDFCTYIVKDNDGLSSNEAKVIFYIHSKSKPKKSRPKNRAPKAYDKNISTLEDSSVKILLEADDEDNDTLEYHIINMPKYGTLKKDGEYFIYTPNKNYNGVDNFSFQVSDAKVNSNEAKVFITVLPVNDAPIALDDNATTKEGEAIVINALANDYDPDGNHSNLQIHSVQEPLYGVVRFTKDLIFYTPKKGSLAQKDNFSYTIEDENGAVAKATVRVTIIQHNDAPIAYNKKIQTYEDRAISFEINGSDPDGDSLHYVITNQDKLPMHGKLEGKAPTLVYKPNKDFFGKDYITFIVEDGNLSSNTAVVSIEVLPINDPPIANAGSDESGIRGDIFRLDASKSYDIDGNITEYIWKEDNTTIARQKVFEYKIMSEGIHTFTLIVKDDKNATASDQKIIKVAPCCQGCIYPDPTKTDPFK